MTKYNENLKLKVVKYVIEENHSTYEASKVFEITVSPVKLWVRKYQEHGLKGLLKNRIKYYGNFKLNMIKYIDYYNNKRIKGKLKGMSPVNYRIHSLSVA